MATPFSAKNAKVRYSATTAITMKEWSVEHDVGEIDTSNFEGAGYTDRIAGLKDVTITLTMDYDSGANPLDITGFYPGSNVTNLRLYLNDTTSPYWSFPSAICLKVSEPAKVKEGMPITFTLKNKGTFSLPTGNF